MLVGGVRPWNKNTLLQEILCVSWLDPHHSSTRAHPLGHGAAISLTALWSFLLSPSTSDKNVTDLLAGRVTDEEPRLFGASRERSWRGNDETTISRGYWDVWHSLALLEWNKWVKSCGYSPVSSLLVRQNDRLYGADDARACLYVYTSWQGLFNVQIPLVNTSINVQKHNTNFPRLSLRFLAVFMKPFFSSQVFNKQVSEH